MTWPKRTFEIGQVRTYTSMALMGKVGAISSVSSETVDTADKRDSVVAPSDRLSGPSMLTEGGGAFIELCNNAQWGKGRKQEKKNGKSLVFDQTPLGHPPHFGHF